MCTTLDVAAPSVTMQRGTSSRFVGNATKISTGSHFRTIEDRQFQQGSFVSLWSLSLTITLELLNGLEGSAFA